MTNTTLNGTWLLAAYDLTFRLAQEGTRVRGEFRNKTITCDLSGTFDGHTLAFKWTTAFNWAGQAETGEGVLQLSQDGTILTGTFTLLGERGTWTLTRPQSAARGVQIPQYGKRKTRTGTPYKPRDPMFDAWQDRAEESARQAGANIKRRMDYWKRKPPK